MSELDFVMHLLRERYALPDASNVSGVSPAKLAEAPREKFEARLSRDSGSKPSDKNPEIIVIRRITRRPK